MKADTNNPLCLEHETPAGSRWPLVAWLLVFLLKAVILMYLQWQYAFFDYFGPEKIGETLSWVQTAIASTGNWGLVLLVSGFAVAMLATFPFFPVVFVCVLAYGWMVGVTLSIITAILGLTLMYVLGQWIGRPAVKLVLGKSIEKIDTVVQGQKLFNVISLRLMFYLNPIASWTLCVSGIPFQTLLLGSVIGAMPGIFIQSWMVHTLIVWGEHAGTSDGVEYSRLLFNILAGVGLMLVLMRWLPKRIKAIAEKQRIH